MTKKTTGLISAAKKPGKYVTDIETLKSEVKESDSQRTDNSGQSNEASYTKEAKEGHVMPLKNTTLQPVVGLHIPIPQDLRDQLKVKAINEGKKMKDAVISLIEEYVAR